MSYTIFNLITAVIFHRNGYALGRCNRPHLKVEEQSNRVMNARKDTGSWIVWTHMLIHQSDKDEIDTTTLIACNPCTQALFRRGKSLITVGARAIYFHYVMIHVIYSDQHPFYHFAKAQQSFFKLL